MNADQRRARIAALIADSPDASSRSIAKAVGCSQATVVRDLAFLRGDSVIHLSVNQFEQQAGSDVPPQPTRGDALVQRLTTEMTEQGLVPTSAEHELLGVVHDLADRIELLTGIVAEDGERRTKDGRIFAHPFISEIRQLEAALARVLPSIQTMETPQKNVTKQRAAQTKWRRHNRQTGLTADETPVGHWDGA
jgi:hypothetical protein